MDYEGKNKNESPTRIINYYVLIIWNTLIPI